MSKFILLVVLAGLNISGDATSKSLPNGLYGASPEVCIFQVGREDLADGAGFPAPSAVVVHPVSYSPAGWVCGPSGCRPAASLRTIPHYSPTIRSFRTVRPFFARRTGRGIFHRWRI